MYLGAYTACLHDLSLRDALKTLRELGLRGAEINSGGFVGTPHLPIDDIRGSEGARQEYLGAFEEQGPKLTALNCNGNPLHADSEVRAKHSQDIVNSIEIAALLGVKRVVTMSGTPGVDANASLSSWNVLPWESSMLEVRDYQWNEVAIPFWKDIQSRAADADVKVALDMPHQHRLQPGHDDPPGRGRELDPHRRGDGPEPPLLEGIDPVLAVDYLGELVINAAAKDTRINEMAKINGVLDDRFTTLDPGDPAYLPLGGRFYLSGWPKDSSWDFVAVGRGHDTAYWTDFLRALSRVDPDMAVDIEHEDQELDRMEGLRLAASTLLEAEKAL